MDETLIKRQWVAKKEEMQTIQQIKLIETRVKRLTADDKRIQLVIKKAQERAQKHEELCKLNEDWQMKLNRQKLLKLHNQQNLQEKHIQDRYQQTLLHSEKLQKFNEKRKKQSMQLRVESFKNQQQIQHQKQLQQEKAKRYQFLIQARKNEAKMRISDFWSLQIKSVENEQFEKLREIKEKGQILQSKMEQLNEAERLVLHKIQRSQVTHQNIRNQLHKPVTKLDQNIDFDDYQEYQSTQKKNHTQYTPRKPGQVYLQNINQNIIQQLKLPYTSQQKSHRKKRSNEQTNFLTDAQQRNRSAKSINRRVRSNSLRLQMVKSDNSEIEINHQRDKQIQTSQKW